MKITNFKNIFGGAALGLAIIAGGATAAQAQETQTQPQAGQKTEKQWKHKRGGEGFKRGGKHGRGGEMRMLAQLNLTEAQREQIQQIHERFRESNKGQREQFRANGTAPDPAQREQIREQRQQMRAQRKAAHEQLQAEVLNVLTAEQKTQLEQLKAERKQQFEQRRQMFEQRRQQRQPAQPAPSVN